VTLLATFLALVFVFSLISARVGRTILTPPILFTAAGAAVSLLTSELGVHEGNLDTFLTLAEIGLVLLLFSDASRTDLGLLRDIRALPARLLGPGMLLTLLLGTLGALAVFRQLTFWEAGILAAILAPTDAGLGQIIVNSPRVPRKIREALNVEAGLNDGLSVPFLLFFIALAGSGFSGSEATLHQFIWEQLGYGTLVGLGLGLAGGWLLGIAHRKHAVTAAWSQLGVVTLPLLSLIISEEVGASMFIAAFVGGLAVQVFFKQAGQHAIEFTEEWGQILNLSVFFLFGMVVVLALPEFTAAHWVYAVLSLTLVRMLPVAIALLGTKVSRATVLFMGWFGPRGLASIVLALVYLEHHAGHPGESSIRLAAMATILLSILLHGLTARPGIGLYARVVTKLDPSAPEREECKHPA
jgi:NhaP-type Na+/H+ or K+/H+ antiporter